MLLRSNKTGTITSLEVPDEVMNHPNVVDFHWDVAVGDPVRAFQIGPDRIGQIIVRSDTAEEGERLVEHLASLVKIGVDEHPLE